MKPINEMSLQECHEYLHDFSWGYHNERDAIREVADRIHELTRWISVDERLPTEADADEYGNVLMFETEKESPYRMYPVIERWNDIKEEYFYKPTHWRRIDKP